MAKPPEIPVESNVGLNSDALERVEQNALRVQMQQVLPNARIATVEGYIADNRTEIPVGIIDSIESIKRSIYQERTMRKAHTGRLAALDAGFVMGITIGSLIQRSDVRGYYSQVATTLRAQTQIEGRDIRTFLQQIERPRGMKLVRQLDVYKGNTVLPRARFENTVYRRCASYMMDIAFFDALSVELRAAQPKVEDHKEYVGSIKDDIKALRDAYTKHEPLRTKHLPDDMLPGVEGETSPDSPS